MFEQEAEEFRRNLKEQIITDDDFERLEQFDVNVEEAYIAGAKAHQTQWHDLRKNPEDLPDNERYVWTNAGAGYHDVDGWWDEYGRLNDVVAWCEPKFKE